MKRQLLLVVFVMMFLRLANSATIIADHTVVDQYDKIPQQWINEVKKMWINIAGESHSQAYRTGFTLLMQQNAVFAANVIEPPNPNADILPDPEPYTDQHLRVSKAMRTPYGRWQYWGTGEADWYTWYIGDPSGGDVIKDHITYCETNNLHISVIGFGWCWDATWHNNPGGTMDPVYHVRWAGASEGGPDGDRRWGLDADDYALTGNRVCMDTYLQATEAYRTFCQINTNNTTVIFTTGPVDGADGESGYQRHLKYEYIRNYVKTHADRILFDYADILCYDDNGQATTTSWTDSLGGAHTFPVITEINAGDGSVGHIGAAGSIRLAKAQWWLLARIAGWDGTTSNSKPVISLVSNLTKNEGDKIEFDVIVTDANTSDSITLTPSGMIAGMTCNPTGNNRIWKFSWQTDFNSAANSPYSITFTANDGTLDSDLMNVSITVNNVSTNLSLTDHKDWN